MFCNRTILESESMLTMKLCIVLSALLVVLLAVNARTAEIMFEELHEQDWQSFKLEYQKNYQNAAEEQLRKQIFKENKEIINKHNARFEIGKETYTMGVNSYTDLSRTEFKSQMHAMLHTDSYEGIAYVYSPAPSARIPATVDWRAKGAVTPVKSQGRGGISAAFVETAVVETYHFLKNHTLLTLSEQYLLDCAMRRDNRLCIAPGLAYVKRFGIDTEKSYRHENRQKICGVQRKHVAARINDVVKVQSLNETALATAVAEHGAVAVTVNADHFQHYRSGIFREHNGGHRPSNHAVAIVGYAKDYWIVRNSWGRNWGEQGYMRLARNAHNQCNIATNPIFVI